MVGRDVERNAVLAGDLKCLVYYVISKLNITYLAGDPKRKGLRIHLWVWANIQSHGYKE